MAVRPGVFLEGPLARRVGSGVDLTVAGIDPVGTGSEPCDEDGYRIALCAMGVQPGPLLRWSFTSRVGFPPNGGPAF